ncbi:MAG: Planctomycete cytochrome [Chthoniobacteraceae bacterium]|nr:Planctomycete cytochrome [Chthoniobacteraceae bacterium]
MLGWRHAKAANRFAHRCQHIYPISFFNHVMKRIRIIKMNRFQLPVFALTAAALMGHRAVRAEEPEGIAFFEKKVRPILSEHCYSCHAADTNASGGLRVDDRNGLLAGGKTGPAIIEGDPENSLLLQRVRHGNAKRQMPKEGDLLTEEEIADLTTWIKDGVAWPREKIPASIGRVRADYAALKTSHWAWQPLSKPALPSVADSNWPLGAIDQFILARLESSKLSPVPEADPVTLIRRITFDLTGLPPTPAEIEAFRKNSSRENFAMVVDRLLESSQFGERWGRHWLDVARYGESTGPSRNIPYPNAWKYRDYVLDAVSKDLPYNRFIQEQIAGDLLPAETPAERDRLLTATGFLALGVKDVNQRFKTRFIMDNVDEQIDTVTRSVLGLTVSCARCHDHKFDPIPTTDYYSLAGIFTSTDDCAGVRNKMGGGGLDYYDPAMLVKLATEAPEPPAEEVARLQAIVDETKKAWDAIRGTPEGLKPAANGKPTQRPFRVKYEAARGDLLALSDPATRGYAVHGVREAKKVGDTEVRIRGEAERLGPTVQRGFLTAFTMAEVPAITPGQSGRLELAQWLTSPANPLTPRVIVNRVWQHLFGVGIVNTVDNFGVKGDQPSHPELLDYLASEFIGNDWSIKKLIKTIVLSRAYQLGGEAPAGHQEIDPANRLVWRHSPRRLDAEEIRDAMLASAGRLESKPSNGSPVRELRMVELRDNGPEARKIQEQAGRGLSRSVYLPLLRGLTPATLEAFDPVQQTLVTGQRDASTVPTQALYLLNSTFVRQQALALAERELAEADRDEPDWIRHAYLLTLGREPSVQEAARAEKYLLEYESAYRELQPDTSPRPADESAEPTAEEEPVNPDDIDRTVALVKEDVVQPKTPKAAAWATFIQALYASAEFRFVR